MGNCFEPPCGLDFVNLTATFPNETLSVFPDNESCISSGLNYHIHEIWGYNDSGIRIGEDDCGSMYTGGHWDPWISSGTDYSSTECGSNDNYNCTSNTYDNSAYSCEVGDWGGKYGTIDAAFGPKNFYEFATQFNSNYEVSGYDTTNKSVVFHCGESGKRAFCAPLVRMQDFKDTQICGGGQCCSGANNNTKCDYSQMYFDDSMNETNISISFSFGSDDNITIFASRINMNSYNLDTLSSIVHSNYAGMYYKGYYAAIYGEGTFDGDTLFSDVGIYNPHALFQDNGGGFAFAVVNSNSEYDMDIDGDGLVFMSYDDGFFGINVTIPENCTIDGSGLDAPGGLLYRIYDDWMAPEGIDFTLNGTECENYVGYYYDPINSCEMDSNSKDYCNCTQYNCDYKDYFNGTNRFGCSPSDLSGKYGPIWQNQSDNVFGDAYGMFTKNITIRYDSLGITSDELNGKSLVVQCQNNYQMVACSKFIQYNFTSTQASSTTTTVTTETTNIVGNTNTESTNVGSNTMDNSDSEDSTTSLMSCISSCSFALVVVFLNGFQF